MRDKIINLSIEDAALEIIFDVCVGTSGTFMSRNTIGTIPCSPVRVFSAYIHCSST